MKIKTFECKEFISFSLLHEDSFIVKQGPSDFFPKKQNALKKERFKTIRKKQKYVQLMPCRYLIPYVTELLQSEN